MKKIRLFGLVLIMTTMLLGLAAVVSHTWEIRIQQLKFSPPLGAVDGASPAPSQEVKFVRVPVLFPLAAAGFLGLLFWFLPEVLLLQRSHRRTARSKSSRRRRIFFSMRS
jgi:hypothetical protein